MNTYSKTCDNTYYKGLFKLSIRLARSGDSSMSLLHDPCVSFRHDTIILIHIVCPSVSMA